MKEIIYSPADIAAAHRIARRMFEGRPDLVEGRHVIACAEALKIGMKDMRVIWDEPDGDKKTLEGATK